MVDVSKIKKENESHTFIMTCIDVFQKKAWAVPMLNKKGKTCLEAFKKILEKSNRKPKRLQVDKGSEFYNKDFEMFMKEKNIKLYSTNSELKASIIERFNRTLKEKMWRYFTFAKTNKYTDVLDDLIKSYNNTYHSSIKTKPDLVKKNEEGKIFLRLNGYQKEKGPKEYIKINLKIGDKVRISKNKNIFEKSYTPNRAKEIFIIEKIVPSIPPSYIIKDLNNETIEGTFYEKELQKVFKIDTVYTIETILKRKKINREAFIF